MAKVSFFMERQKRIQWTKKHEIYAAAFGSHLFMTDFYRAWDGGMAPWFRIHY